MSLISQVYAAGDGNIAVIKPTNVKIEDIGKLISSAVSVVIIVAGILAFVFLVIGGIEWLTSGGDKTKTEVARNRITAALVGLAIIAASWALMQLVAYFFGIDVLGGSVTIPRPF